MLFNWPDTLKGATSRGIIYIPHNAFPGPTRLKIANCILIGAAIFAQLTEKSSYTTLS